VSYAWVFNLDAEFELARPRYATPQRLQVQLDQHGSSSRALMAPDDVLAAPGLVDAHLFTGRAWSPTPFALEALRKAGVTPEPHPSVEVLRRVNHRRFAHELGGGLTDQHYVESWAEVEAVLNRAPHSPARGWLLKRPLAFAGRGQLRIASVPDTRQRDWITASLRNDGLVIEPWVTPTLEASQHGFVQPNGEWILGPPCIQTVSAKGAPLSVVRAAPGTLSLAEAVALHEQGARVAQALHAADYFGPFGIDAYRHESGFCALSEINARFTLGFAVSFPSTPLLQVP
jgi:hypothetical protein